MKKYKVFIYGNSSNDEFLRIVFRSNIFVAASYRSGVFGQIEKEISEAETAQIFHENKRRKSGKIKLYDSFEITI